MTPCGEIEALYMTVCCRKSLHDDEEMLHNHIIWIEFLIFGLLWPQVPWIPAPGKRRTEVNGPQDMVGIRFATWIKRRTESQAMSFPHHVVHRNGLQVGKLTQSMIEDGNA